MSLSSLIAATLYILYVITQLVIRSHGQALQTVADHVEAGIAVGSLLTEYPGLAQQLQEAQNELQQSWTAPFFDHPPQQNGSSLSPCQKALKSLQPNVTNSTFHVSPSLLPILDATGKQGAGLLEGNTIWDGAFDECFNYNFTGFCQASMVTSSILLTELPLSWIMRFCVPKQCNSSDVAKLINDTNLFEVDESDVKCMTTKKSGYNGGAIAMLTVTCIFLFVIIFATLIDGVLKVSNSNQVTAINSAGIKDLEKKSLLDWNKAVNVQKVKLLDFVTAFSLYKTVPMLLATTQASTVITCLNGLRVISMLWVILGHTHLGALTPGVIDNPIKIKDVMSRFTFQPIANGFFAVDTFFFLSAVLVAYLTLREMEKKNGRFPFLHFYIHRYLRLTPTYAFILFFAWALTDNIAYGPGISLTPSVMGDCTKVWWTNFLYINNLYPWTEQDECMRWTWYLANDMQFYIISPIIVYFLYHFLQVAVIILIVLLVSSSATIASLVAVYDLQSTIFSKAAYNYSGHATAAQYTDLIYIKPWGRIAPYLVGLALGYVLFKKYHFKLRRLANILLYLALWVVAGILLIIVLYGLYFVWHGHALTKLENVMYITFSRLTWAVGLALIVLACNNDYGGFVNSFLSMKIWTPLSRMTFNAYLVHPVLLYIIYGQFQKAFHYTDVTMVCYFLALTVLSFGVAGVICVMVEIPLGMIEMLVFKKVGMKGRNSSQWQVNATPAREVARPEATTQFETSVQNQEEAEYSVDNQSLHVSTEAPAKT